MKKPLLSLLFIFCFCAVALAQGINYTKKPSEASIKEAKEIAASLFNDLKSKRHEKIADFIVSNLGASWDSSTRIKNKNDYMAKMEIITMPPPDGIYGTIGGYDLIDEAYLPGSDRYFRHTYITYHDGSKLVWEFRFYVNNKQKVTVDYIGWSEENPFEYLSTPDMIIPRYSR